MDRKMEWIIVLLYHMIVAGGIAILAIGVSSLESSDPKPNSLTLVKVGAAILTVSWILVSAWAGFSFVSAKKRADAVLFREGTTVRSAIHPSAWNQQCNILTFMLAPIRCDRRTYLHWRSRHLYPRRIDYAKPEP